MLFLKIFDNALEFFQKDLQTYCASLGILHQATCSHTSQKNGIAERKHRYIIDVACTIMLQMNVPKYLWYDAILMATYLVNGMPFSALGGALPLTRLCLDTPLFHLPPKVFGCIAFIQDLSLDLDKLSPRSIKCVSLGYSRTKKGYRYNTYYYTVLCFY